MSTLRPLKPCRHPGCRTLSRDASGYCPPHADAARARAAEREARQDKVRGSAAARGYGRAWRTIRAQVLREEPLCRACAAQGQLVPATDVDHIVSRARGGTDDRANLQPLCHRCHTAKTNREDGGRPRGGGG